MKADKQLLFGFAMLLLSVFTSPLFAQTTTDSSLATSVQYKIVMRNGTEYIGKILFDDGREVLVMTEELGKIYLNKSDLKSMTLYTETNQAKPIIKGTQREAGPFTTRYYFTNNALPIKKGEDYAMLHAYGPEVHFAVTENLTLGVMATWIASPVAFAAKYSFKTSNEKLNFSLGTIMLSSGYLFNAQGWGGLHWGTVTYGVAGKNTSFSGGYGYLYLPFGKRSEMPKLSDRLRHGPSLSIGGIAPVGKSASFIFDAMGFITQQINFAQFGTPKHYNKGNKFTSVIMPGMRFQATEGFAIQIALAGIIEVTEKGYNYYANLPRVISFPLPMASMFFKF